VVDWPLVGRAGELDRLRTKILDVNCRGVVLAAPAGVGKTRIALECLDLADRAGLATARITGSRSSADLPFGAVAPLLGPHPMQEESAAIDRTDLLRHAAAEVGKLAAGRRIVLVADEGHHLDDASATLLLHLALTNTAFIFVTLRTGEPAPDAVAALWKDGLVERIDLPSLPAEAIEELLTSVLGGPIDPAAMKVIADRSQGNALFLRELVLGSCADGTLRDEGGIWRLTGPLSPSARLVELVERRLAGLSAPERALLEIVAFGEPLRWAELVALGDPATADRLERQSILISEIHDYGVQVRLAHPIYGDVIRSQIPALREVGVARALADAVEARGALGREDNLRVASWRLVGGGLRAEPMQEAATTARWLYDFPLAERLARAAVNAGGGFEASLLAAQLAGLQGHREQADKELAELATRPSDDAQKVALALTRLDLVYFGTDQLDHAWRIAEEAERAIIEPRWQNEITARRSWLSLQLYGPRAAAETSLPLLTGARGRALVWASIVASRSLGLMGQVDASLEVARKGLQAYQECGEHLDWYPWIFTYEQCLALAYAGNFADADRNAQIEYARALSDASAEAQAWFSWFFAAVVGDRGQVRTAASYAREAIAIFRQLDRPRLARACLVSLATSLALSGLASEAAAVLQEHDDFGRPAAPWLVDILQARAWSAAAAGDLPQARTFLDEAAQVGVDTGSLVGAVSALHGLARLCDAARVLPQLTTLAAQVEGDLAKARVGHTEALVAGDPLWLEAVSTRFQAMGADLLAAEAAADAAVLWHKMSNARRSAAAERRAAAIAERCEGAVTPALQMIAARSQLTPAEQETARLAAAGRSNKAIAVQLCISVRTAENRLQRVYEKLGVSGRDELMIVLSEG
jgi:DNA-binding CsgD family transcriptional regulator